MHSLSRARCSVRDPRTTKISSTKYLSPTPNPAPRPPARPSPIDMVRISAPQLKWEMFRSCSRSQILLPRCPDIRKGCGAAAARRPTAGAGQAARHGWSLIAEWAEVSREECLAWVRVPMMTPSPPSHTHREGVPNDAQQRVVTPPAVKASRYV